MIRKAVAVVRASMGIASEPRHGKGSSAVTAAPMLALTPALSDERPIRTYFYCRKVSKWQFGRCGHWRCKRASYFPDFPTPPLERTQGPRENEQHG